MKRDGTSRPPARLASWPDAHRGSDAARRGIDLSPDGHASRSQGQRAGLRDPALLGVRPRREKKTRLRPVPSPSEQDVSETGGAYTAQSSRPVARAGESGVPPT